MKIVFIGMVDFSKQALMKLIDLKAEIAGVISRKTSPFNADFADVSEICKENAIPLFYTQDVNNDECLKWMGARQPDIIFCFGWSQLIKKPLLSLAPLGVIGFHPTLLPGNRGRHPIIWALALGLEKTGSTFFFMDEGADSGDILSQAEIPIAYSDSACTLYRKITACALKQIEAFLPSLFNNSYERVAQDHSKATYWRKRTFNDGLIDWRMPARGIYNLVRALTKPYAGAHALCRSKPFKIWSALEAPAGDYPRAIEPGKVIEVLTSDKTFTVKCGIGAIKVTGHELTSLPENGEYL